MQDAADDLVVRLLRLVMAWRHSGFTFSTEARLDRNTVEFLWELGDLAERGEDIRGRLFGEAAA